MDKLRTILQKLYPHVQNKYRVTFLIFMIWMTFFDENNLISQVENRMKLSELKAEKEHYMKEIAQNTQELKLLQNDKELLEKFARERYLMKKTDEEIFVFAIEDPE